MADAIGALQSAATIALPRPQKSGGKPLFDALSERRSRREFRTDALDAQTLSNLLWAGFGLNREDGGRTAPSAHNWQEIDVYVALPEGLYLFEARAYELRLVVARDLRGETGVQDFVATAPLNLVYVADLARMDTADRAEKRFYAAADAAFVAQNVYLFCASEGLAVVVRGLIDRAGLAASMRLRADQRVILAQTIGYSRE